MSMKKDLVAWLDAIVELKKEELRLSAFDSSILTCASLARVQLHKGIDKLSKEIGIPLVVDSNWGESYKYRYSFTYKGIEFCQLEEGSLLCEDRT